MAFWTGKRLRRQGLWLEDLKTISIDFESFTKAIASGFEAVFVFLWYFQELA